MTKSERVGTLVVIAAIIVILLAGWLLRRCDNNIADEKRVAGQVAEFAAEIDSLWSPAVEQAASTKNKTDRKRTKTATKRTKAASKSTPSPQRAEAIPNLAGSSNDK